MKRYARPLIVTLNLVAGCAADGARVATETSAPVVPGVAAQNSLRGDGCGAALADRRFSRLALGSFDQALMARALLGATNEVRCRRGLAALRPDPALSKAAAMHGADMVRHRFVGHSSPVSGRSHFTDRMKLANARFGRASETIATANLLDFEEGRPVYPLGGACRFSYQPDGEPFAPRSYRQLARTVVQRWIESPSHRDSLLDRGFRRAGQGAATGSDSGICGRIVAVQLYSE